MGGSWGYKPDDTYKSAASLVQHALRGRRPRAATCCSTSAPVPTAPCRPRRSSGWRPSPAGWTRHAEAIHGTTAGLEPWQWYGPSTRSGDRTHLFALARPYESVTVRGVPIRRIERVVHLATGEELPFTTRTSVIDELINADPLGELTIPIRPDHVDDLATVFALDVAPVAPCAAA